MIVTKSNSFASHRVTFILLMSLISFLFITNFIWIKQDIYNSVTVAEYCKINNLIKVFLDFIDVFQRNKSFFDIIKGLGGILHTGSNSYLGVDSPRLIYFISSIWMYLFGFSVISAKLSNMLYFIILIFSVYYLGTKIRGPVTGLLSAFLISMYPVAFAVSRGYGHDFPLMAFVSLCICTIVYSECFSKRMLSIISGVSLWLGMLIKPQILFFVIGPLLIVLVRASLGRKRKIGISKVKILLNIALFLIAVFAISAFWWWGNINKIYATFLKHFFEPHCIGNTLSFSQLQTSVLNNVPGGLFSKTFFYLDAVIKYTGIPFFLLFVLGLAYFLKKITFEKTIILSWFFISYVIFTLISNKYAKYFFPAFPAIALISAIGLSDWFMENRQKFNCKIARIAKLIIPVLALSQFFYLSWFYNKHESEIRKPKPLYLNVSTVNNFKHALENVPDTEKRIGIIRKEGVWGMDEGIFLCYLFQMEMPHAFIMPSFFQNPFDFLDFFETFNYLIVVNYPLDAVKNKLFLVNKDMSILDHSFVNPPVSTIYMWRSAYQKEGMEGLIVNYNTPELWIDRQGYEDFVNRLGGDSSKLQPAYRKLYKFVDSFKEYKIIADGPFQYGNAVMRIYLLRKKYKIMEPLRNSSETTLSI